MPWARPCTSPASSRRTSRRSCSATWGCPTGSAFQSFANALGWIAQIGLFVLLGLLADPTRLGEQLVPAIVIGLVLLLVARPLSVVASVSWFKVPWRDQVFLSWAGLRGAVPVVLATVPLVVGTPDTEWIFDLVFMLVVVFTIVQAPSLPWVARRLGLTEQVHSVEKFPQQGQRGGRRRWVMR